jgi:endonuclease YncB( thermonuclease family)
MNPFLFTFKILQKFTRHWSPLHPWIVLFLTAPVLSLMESRLQSAPLKTQEEDLHFLSCHDGDTCRAKNSDGATLVLRLVGIDTPEIAFHQKLGQSYGIEAQKKIESLLKNKSFKVQIVGSDKYKRYLAIILDPKLSNASTSLNELMIEEGFAFAYTGKNQMREIRAWALAAQDRAQKKRTGFWSLPQHLRPQDPSEFRKKRVHR